MTALEWMAIGWALAAAWALGHLMGLNASPPSGDCNHFHGGGCSACAKRRRRR